MEEKVDVFVCKECGYEDSSFIPSGIKMQGSLNCKNGYIQCPNCGKTVERNIVSMKHEKGMTLEEYLKLTQYIYENHSFPKLKGKFIKYISHTFDFRTGRIYKVVLDDKVFAKVNENGHKNLDKWIRNYLDN